ncbi:MAG: hypothetical protein ACLGIF_03630, partial [Actinomycetes bacterium]
MPLSSRDQAFAVFVAAHRAPLLAAAGLLTGDPEQAARRTEMALARLYGAWTRTGDPLSVAYGFLVRGGPADSLPWRREDRVLLTDAAAVRPAIPLLDDLGTLTV